MMPINPHSPEARALRDWATARLTQHRTALESLSTDLARVPELRGRLAECRALLDWITPEDTHG